MAGQQGISLPRSLSEKARAMALADLAWMKPDRTQPLNGDSDRTDLRDVFTPAAWILKDNRLRYAGYDRLDFESVWGSWGGCCPGIREHEIRETPECLFMPWSKAETGASGPDGTEMRITSTLSAVPWEAAMDILTNCMWICP